MLVEGLEGGEVVDGGVVEVVCGGRVRKHHGDRLDHRGAEEARLRLHEPLVRSARLGLVHHRVRVRAAEGLVRQVGLGRRVERLELAEDEQVQANLLCGGAAARVGARRGGELLERLRGRVAGHGPLQLRRLLGALLLEGELAEVVKVVLEVLHRLEGEQDAEARLARRGRVLPRHGRLLLALAQVRLEGDVGHAALPVPEHHRGADDGALERLVRGGDHREQLGLAQLELSGEPVDRVELGLRLHAVARHLLEDGQHELLVLLGDVVAAVGDDLLRLALHAGVLRGGELREAAEQLEDLGVHVREVAEEVEHVEDQRHLAIKLLVREDGLQHGRRVREGLVEVLDADDLGAVVGVDLLHLEEVLEDRRQREGRHVEHPALVLLAKRRHRLGRVLEGGRRRLVERVGEGGEGGEDRVAKAVSAVRRRAPRGREQLGERLARLLWQLGARPGHELVILGPHDALVEEQLGELVEHVVLVVDEAAEHVVRARDQVRHLLVHRDVVLAHLRRRLEVAERLVEGDGARNQRRVVELELGDLLARLDKDVRGLEQSDGARLRRRQREEHLHDLHLREGAALGQVRPVLGEPARQLAAVRGDKDGGVVLLLEHRHHSVEHHPDLVAGLLHEVEGVGAVAVGGDEVAARRRLELDRGERAVRRDGEELGRVAVHLELELGLVPDELDLELRQLRE
mmetsp:Transcript_27949/g.82424  ORF Transcript_27949/g.82424 Transcript_27949/m.82424 type:complete len:688 (-) Transcript_27949:997-3060(-)